MTDTAADPRARAGWTRGTVRAVAALVLAAFGLSAWRFDFLCDDAYISFRYADHLARGLGLRFNPDASPPVEGYSNFLWVVLLAGWRLVGVGPELASRAMSVASGAALVLALLRFLRTRVGLGPPACAVAGLSFALMPPVGPWATSGLETMPFALLFFLAFVELERDAPRPVRAGLLLLALTLLRTDGLLWALLLGACAWVAWPAGERRARARTLRPGLALVLAGQVLFVLGRRLYFGEWVSNTARAKGEVTAFTLGRGASYAASFVLDHPSSVLVLAAALVLLRGRDGRVRASALVVLATTAYAVVVGGDFMPFYRFFLVATPFLALLLGAVLARSGSAGLALGVACVVLSLPPAFGGSLVPLAWREACRFRWTFFLEREDPPPVGELAAWERSRENCAKWARLGKALAAVTEPGEWIVLGPIGAAGYFSRLNVLDQGGLVDPWVDQRPPSEVRRSPGHDKAVPVLWFTAGHPRTVRYPVPTYTYARVVARGAKLDQAREKTRDLFLGEGHVEDGPPGGCLQNIYSDEVRELPRGEFEPDEVLVVGKFFPGIVCLF